MFGATLVLGASCSDGEERLQNPPSSHPLPGRRGPFAGAPWETSQDRQEPSAGPKGPGTDFRAQLLRSFWTLDEEPLSQAPGAENVTPQRYKGEAACFGPEVEEEMAGGDQGSPGGPKRRG